MNTTHVFAIGGTGARIVKSLSFLLAAGYPINKDRTIKPIFLDPDRGNGDAQRTHRALTLYHQIQQATKGEAPFFSGPVEKPFQGERASWSASLGVEAGHNFFHEKINFNGLGQNMQDFTRLLFGTALLNTTLENGYLGNPNVGTVAMNAVKSEKWFNDFADNFKEGDDIILVASIFGGTGAAGLPLMVKTLRKANENNIPNPDRLEKARIGAVVVQPYFGVKTTADSPIDHNTFIVKTKAALAHYAKDIDADIDVNYPIGDPVAADAYENEKGGNQQKNPAHFVELVGALSIIDFVNGRGEGFVPFGIKEYVADTMFKHLGQDIEPNLQRALSTYAYCVKHWKERISHSINSNQSWTQRMGREGKPLQPGFTRADDFFRSLEEFNELFLTWLRELRGQSRAFFPINYEVDEETLHELVRGVTQKRVGLLRRSKWGYKQFDEQLNKSEQGMSTGETPRRFLKLYHAAISAIYDERIAQ